MLDFCVNTHFSAAKIRFFDEFTKDFCVNTHFSAVKSVFKNLSSGGVLN